MKTIGMIGGMSWESTVTYYQIANRDDAGPAGRRHSAKILMESYNFAEMAALQKSGRWDEARGIMEETRPQAGPRRRRLPHDLLQHHAS